jgi:hydroxyacylglutathione hydrolase
MTTPTPSPGCQIETFTLGPYATNCFLVYQGGAADAAPGAARECWIIDASFEPTPIAERISQLRLEPSKLILTHAHIDHIAGVGELLSKFPRCELLIHEAEQAWLSNPALNLSAMAGMPVTTREAHRLLHHDETLRLGQHSWRVLHTPGHSPGGITLYSEEARAAIVGDALFAGSIGRTDFPGCDFETLATSIRTRLYTLPDATTVYPGHGPTTTIGREKLSNPFVRP